MQKKFIPLAFVVVGFLASFLPIESVDVTGANAALARTLEAEGTVNAWTFGPGKGAGPVLLTGLALVAIFAGLAAAKGLRRGFAIPMVLFGGFACFIASTMARGFSRSEVVAGDLTVTGSPGLGLIILLCVFAAVAGAGVYGTLKPDRA